MSYQTRTKFTNIIVYSLLGIIIASVVAVSVITFTSAKKKSGNIQTPESTQMNDTASPSTAKMTDANKDIPKTDLTPDNPKPTPTPKKTDKLPANNDDIESFTNPVNGYVMKSYSVDMPVFSLTTNDYRAHKGIDISVPEGSGVAAVANGTITKIYDDPMFGKTIHIEHSGNITSIYSNLADELAEGIIVGMKVGEGQIIGSVGSSAIVEIADTDHLHFELLKGSVAVDPLKYFKYSLTPVTDIPGVE